jgi:2-dehydropantoate 2-reductase
MYKRSRLGEMGFKSIIVLGAGGIGSAYGAFLSRKNDVALIGNEAHVRAVNSDGLRISGEKSGTFEPRADTRIRRIPEQALILLTTKAYDLAKAVGAIKRFLRKDTVILVLQNGLGNEDVVKSVVGSRVKVLRAITTMAAEFFRPGEIRYWQGETIIERAEAAARIAETFNDCGLKTIVCEDVNKEIWSKLVVNSVVNPLTAVFRVRNNEIRADSLKTIRHQIVKECVAVGRTQGIKFPANLAEKIDDGIANYTNFSSMCQDIIKGKKTEIDFLNGKIVELGRKNRVPTPVNQTLVCMIKFLEENHGLPRHD